MPPTTSPADDPSGHGEDHRAAYSEALSEIKADVVKLAAHTGEQIGAATQALLDGDLALVDHVLADEQRFHDLGLTLEHRVFELMARQSPVASDLRTLVAVLRILQELSLTAGLMRNVARTTRRIYPAELSPKVRGLLQRMGAQASIQLHLAVDAFADMDIASGSALPDMDDVMDQTYRDLFRTVFSQGAADETELQLAVETTSLARDYERAGDHAVMIARWTRFIVTGAFPRDPEVLPKSDSED